MRAGVGGGEQAGVVSLRLRMGRSRQDRIEMLAEPRNARWEKYAKKRAEAEASAIVECSFRPKARRASPTLLDPSPPGPPDLSPLQQRG